MRNCCHNCWVIGEMKGWRRGISDWLHVCWKRLEAIELMFGGDGWMGGRVADVGRQMIKISTEK